MADVLGANVHLGLGAEATPGTAVAPTRWLGKLEFDFFERQDGILNETAYGHLAAHSGRHVLREFGEGSMTSKLFDRSYGDLLVLLFGQAPTTADVVGDTTVKDHTFELLNSTEHKTYTLAVQEGDVEDMRYPGAMVTGGSIEIAVDDYVRTSVDFLSQLPATATNTPAYTEENEFVPSHVTTKLVADGGDLDAASALADVRSITVNIGKNPIRKETLGNKNVTPRIGRNEATIEMELYYNATTFRDYRRNNTKLNLRVDITNTDVTIGTSSNPRLRLEAPVYVEDWEPGYDEGDLIMQTVTFRVVRDVGSGDWLTAVLRNLATVYPTA